jgi:hypothetical protein
MDFSIVPNVETQRNRQFLIRVPMVILGKTIGRKIMSNHRIIAMVAELPWTNVKHFKLAPAVVANAIFGDKFNN